MDMFSFIITILGLCVFEVVSSIDNAVVNADVLSTMEKKWRKWFLVWGIFFSVFLVRGLLPWILVWASSPSLGFLGALTATFSDNHEVTQALEKSTPLLLMAGGMFMVFLFLHWLFLEKKEFGLSIEKVFAQNGVWFFTISSVFLTVVIWQAVKIDAYLAFSASVGATAFFITHGFKEYAARAEIELKEKSNMSDISKLMYLEVLDATFSIDGVVGAFAFTTSVPLIILGNGLGAVVVRELTIHGVDRIRNYAYLKNGAMYSIFLLGVVMLADSFGVHIPFYVAPIGTFIVLGYFFSISVKKKNQVKK